MPRREHAGTSNRSLAICCCIIVYQYIIPLMTLFTRRRKWWFKLEIIFLAYFFSFNVEIMRCWDMKGEKKTKKKYERIQQHTLKSKRVWLPVSSSFNVSIFLSLLHRRLCLFGRKNIAFSPKNWRLGDTKEGKNIKHFLYNKSEMSSSLLGIKGIWFNYH